MKRKENTKAQAPQVLIDTDVLRQIRQHAHAHPKSEVCGILIGSEHDKQVEVEACIAGLNASQGGTHVTFTQDTWEHIYQIKDAEYPDHRMVGWYHSHPGFGVFLSEHDTFIHQNFFSAPLQVAWVYDPESDEEGCFGWVGKRLERLSEISVTDGKGGEGAGESGKTEPVVFPSEDEEGQEEKSERSRTAVEPPPAWIRWSVTVLSYLSTAALGFAISWFLFPRLIPMLLLVDPQTHQIIDLQTRQIIGYVDPYTGQFVPDPQGPHAFDPGKLPSLNTVPGQPPPATPNASGPDKGKK